jgi:hypothetical protein
MITQRSKPKQLPNIRSWSKQLPFVHSDHSYVSSINKKRRTWLSRLLLYWIFTLMNLNRRTYQFSGINLFTNPNNYQILGLGQNSYHLFTLIIPMSVQLTKITQIQYSRYFKNTNFLFILLITFEKLDFSLMSLDTTLGT